MLWRLRVLCEAAAAKRAFDLLCVACACVLTCEVQCCSELCRAVITRAVGHCYSQTCTPPSRQGNNERSTHRDGSQRRYNACHPAPSTGSRRALAERRDVERHGVGSNGSEGANQKDEHLSRGSRHHRVAQAPAGKFGRNLTARSGHSLNDVYRLVSRKASMRQPHHGDASRAHMTRTLFFWKQY